MKLRKKDKEKERDKSPRVDKNHIKREIILKGKTPSKSNCELSYNKKFINFHNCFISKNSNNKNKSISNNNTNKSNISQENLVIFGDAGTIVPVRKRFSSRK